MGKGLIAKDEAAGCRRLKLRALIWLIRVTEWGGQRVFKAFPFPTHANALGVFLSVAIPRGAFIRQKAYQGVTLTRLLKNTEVSKPF